MDKLKVLLSSTKGKIFMGVGLAVIILFLVFRNKSGSGSVATSSGGEGSPGSVYGGGAIGSSSGGDESGTDSKAFLDALTELGEQNEFMFNTMQSDYESRTNLLNSNFESMLDEQAAGYAVGITGLKGELESVRNSLNISLAKQAEEKISQSAVSPIVSDNQVTYLQDRVSHAEDTGNKGLATWANNQLINAGVAPVPVEIKGAPPLKAVEPKKVETKVDNQLLYLQNRLKQAKADGNKGLETWANAQLKAGGW